jgi:hypothetical protein
LRHSQQCEIIEHVYDIIKAELRFGLYRHATTEMEREVAGWVDEQYEDDLMRRLVASRRTTGFAEALRLRDLAEFAAARPGQKPGERISEWAADEISVAMRWTRNMALAQLHLARTVVSRLPGTLAALSRGELDLRAVKALAEITDPLDDATAKAVEDAVLTKAGKQNLSELRRAARRAVLRLDPAGAQQRHEKRKQERRVELHPREDAMAELTAVLPAPDAVAIYRRLDDFAHAAPPDDTRTMDQRRADTFTDLLLGDPITTTDHGTTRDDSGTGDENTTSHTDDENTTSGTDDENTTSGTDDGNTTSDNDQDARNNDATGDRASDSHATTSDNDSDASDGDGETSSSSTCAGASGSSSSSSSSSGSDGADISSDSDTEATSTHDATGGRSGAGGVGASGEKAAGSSTAGGFNSSDVPGDISGDRTTTNSGAGSDDHLVSNGGVSDSSGNGGTSGDSSTRGGGTSGRSGGGYGSRRAGTTKTLVQVTVPLSTLMGLDDQPGELAGYGAIPASVARDIAAGGTWKRLLTDPLSGTLLDYGRTTYRPPAGLADFVRARDHTCVFPGCSRPADACDIDHRKPHPEGPTSENNLECLCRHHHRLKHEAGWTVEYHNGVHIWTTPDGHRYHRQPHPIAEPTPQPLPSPATPTEEPPPF